MLQDFHINDVSQRYVEINEDSFSQRVCIKARSWQTQTHRHQIILDPRKSELVITKALGTVNIADALTKYCNVHVTKYHIELTNQQVESDRHELMPEVYT